MRRTHVLSLGVVVSLLLAPLALLAGCESTTLANTSASAVDVQITILDPSVYPYGGTYRPTDVAEVQVKFYPSGFLGRPDGEIFGSDLNHNESFTCNGDALSSDHSGRYTFWGTVKQAPPAGAYTCVYTRAGVATKLTAPALARPTIQTPAAQASVARTAALSLSFTPGLTGPTQVALNRTQALSVAPGVTKALIPAATLAQTATGPGLVIVSQAATVTPSGSGFHRALINVVVAAYVPVTFE